MKIMSMLLLLFIGFEFWGCRFMIEGSVDDEFKACEDVSYNCGELVGIKYPFWGNERQPFCGVQEFKLSCNNNRITTMEIDSVEHNVLKINQSENSMRIARADLSDNICPQTQLKPHIQYDSFFTIGYSNYVSLWYSCFRRNESLDHYTFSCGWEGQNQGRIANYFSTYSGWDNLTWGLSYNELEGCQMSVSVRVSSPVHGNNSKAALEEIVRQGFDVEYKDPLFISSNSGATAIPTGSFILMVSIIIFIYCTWKRISNKNEIEGIIKRYSTLTPKRYTYSKLNKITDSFRHKLGQGGFSTVYKGTLPDGCQVAVKLLKESKEDGEAFMNEVVSITRTSHVNIVAIFGFCYEPNNRALVYEYMPKGSLDKYMFNGELQQNNGVKLDRNMLFNIVMGVARGLEYLHCGCNTRIVHFDIKPHNILLDDEFCPKISDFGLAKQCARESHVSMTGVKGTIGFMAPEMMFRNIGNVSHKSDVYSFGMLVLEMVGERKNPNQGVGESTQEYFPDWIYKDLVQNSVESCRWGNTEIEEEMVRKLIIVGLCCIQTLPEERPAMSEVVAMLEGNVDGLQIPPKPTLFGPPELPQPSSSSISLSCLEQGE